VEAVAREQQSRSFELRAAADLAALARRTRRRPSGEALNDHLTIGVSLEQGHSG